MGVSTARPRYETKADLGKEAAFARVLGQAWQCNMVKLQGRNERIYRVDYALTRADGALFGVAEIKIRDKYPSTKWDHYLISLDKWSHGIQLAQAGPIFRLAVRWEDCDLFYQYSAGDEQYVTMRMSGRTHSYRSEGDIEPCVFIPMTWFQQV